MIGERSLLRFGVLVPFLYFGTDIVSALSYPGYSHARQFASELGSSTAPHPAIFNVGLVITGIAAVLAAAGFMTALRQLETPVVLSWLIAATLLCFALTMIVAGTFPSPDRRHGAFGIVYAVPAGPMLLTGALWRRPETRWVRIFLLTTMLSIIPLFLFMTGVVDIVTRENGGAFQRICGLTLVPWIGVGSYALIRSRASQDTTPR